MLTEFAIVVVLALFNGFFAFAEMAVVTARKSRLKYMAQTSRRAQTVLHLMQSPERFLSTVQVFITLLTSVMGAYSGAKIGATISVWLITLKLPLIAAYALPLGMFFSVSGVVFINMLIGELLPKRLALVNPEKIAVTVAVPLQVLTWISFPFAFVLIWITRHVLRLIGMERVNDAQVSEDEIRLLVAEGVEQGVIDADERNMVNRVLRLGDRQVSSLMTPRPRIAWLDLSLPLDENLSVMRDTPYSRYPVCRGDQQDVLGILELKSLIDTFGSNQVDLFSKLTKPLYVPATARALDLLEEFRDAGCSRCHSGPMLSDFELHAFTRGGEAVRTPSLRNVMRTAPYMHDGRASNLAEVFDIYRRVDGRADPLLRNLRVPGRGDRNDVEAFLQSASDGDFDKSVPDSVPSGLKVGGKRP